MRDLVEDRSIGIHNMENAHLLSKLVPSIIVLTGSTPDQYLHDIVHPGTVEMVQKCLLNKRNEADGGIPEEYLSVRGCLPDEKKCLSPVWTNDWGNDHCWK
jgi:hypothetical protein